MSRCRRLASCGVMGACGVVGLCGVEAEAVGLGVQLVEGLNVWCLGVRSVSAVPSASEYLERVRGRVWVWERAGPDLEALTALMGLLGGEGGGEGASARDSSSRS